MRSGSLFKLLPHEPYDPLDKNGIRNICAVRYAVRNNYNTPQENHRFPGLGRKLRFLLLTILHLKITVTCYLVLVEAKLLKVR